MQRQSRGIRGPRSALTDYLASQNISAQRIRADTEARRAAAVAAAAAAAAAAATANGQDGEVEVKEEEDEEVSSSARLAARDAATQKRKREQAAIDKIKKSKTFRRRKTALDGEDDDDIARAMLPAPAPGQIENCEQCKKRFTVTAYSRTGPDGGLLCPKCSKLLAEEEKAVKKDVKKPANTPAGRGRRKAQSNLLDGQIGVKTLMTLCVETLASNISLADSLGDLPPNAIDRIARLLSKRRLVNPDTLSLFLQPQTEFINLYDAALLGWDDYIKIFQTCSQLKSLKLRNAIQFKDGVMEFLIGRNFSLDNLYLHGASLLTDACWQKYLTMKGESLKGLQIYFTDRHVSDKIIASLKANCPSLTRLKICHNQEVSDEGVELMAQLDKLQHLSLHLVKKTSTLPYVNVVEKIGRNLRTFSIRIVDEVDDRLLDAIHKHCTRLSKLRITHSEFMTDSGFTRLFKDWKNKPLTHIDLELCRHVDSANPGENPHTVGLCSHGFIAMMQHSGLRLRKLNIHGCRDITAKAFEEVFSLDKVYPELVDLEISFCEVTDFIVQSIFKTCPKLKTLNVFGCMKVKYVKVPKGKILVGVPNAMGMIIEGTED